MSDSEQFDRAIEKLLADQSPRQEALSLDEEEQRMLRLAQLLRGSRSQTPSPEFVDRLRDRIMPGSRRVSRRTAFLSGLGAMAAGLLAGVGLDRASQGSSNQAGSGSSTPLIPKGEGTWVAVARVSEVPPGSIRAFDTGALQGFVINRGGNFRAISRICTHMGCKLKFARSQQALVCPCHGAEFDMNGNNLSGPGGYINPLPRLPSVDVRVNGESVEVRTV
jgi:nitrite reductase/ring-hydroxylating ferredoxin subunit